MFQKLIDFGTAWERNRTKSRREDGESDAETVEAMVCEVGTGSVEP